LPICWIYASVSLSLRWYAVS